MSVALLIEINGARAAVDIYVSAQKEWLVMNDARSLREVEEIKVRQERKTQRIECAMTERVGFRGVMCTNIQLRLHV